MPAPGPEPTVSDAIDRWASSGAMALTGWPDSPGLGPPAPLVPRLAAVADLVRRRSSMLGEAVRVDPLLLLTERAAALGLTRRGRTSCGGATKLLRTTDGWIAVSLARDDDVELLPAWLEMDAIPDDHWGALADVAARRPTSGLVARAALLGLPVGGLPAALPPAPRPPAPLAGLPFLGEHLGDCQPPASMGDLLVIDLGSLWAGPLCGSLLADAGAQVVKVESTMRPDGARRGARSFFDLLNAGKRSVALDLTDAAGRALLRSLLERADVVIEASRPRALEQLGIDARRLVSEAGPRVWVAITAHGSLEPGRDRVGFGDDAAVSGGLVTWDGGEPCFCADAVADPAAGLVAAAAVLDALATGGRWRLDVSLAGVAADLAGPTLPVPGGVVPAAPGSRPPRGVAPGLGADTDAVLAERDLVP